MSWLFSQALVEEYSVPTSSDGEPYAQLNVMPTPHKFWRNDKTMEFSDLSRFGLTSRLLTDAHGAAALTSYLEDFPVRTSAKRAAAPASPASAVGCGPKCDGSFVKYDRAESTWKTAQLSLAGGLAEFSETWPRWGSMRNGACWERITPTLRTKGIESGFLPTPTASNTKAHCARGADKGKPREARSYGAHGPLNPRFLEWLMGWPTGWTRLEPLETDKFQEWLGEHSLNLQSDSDKAAA